MKSRKLKTNAVTQNVIELMKQKKMSADELGLKIKVPTIRLNEYLTGQRNFGSKVLGRVAEALDADITDLFGSEEIGITDRFTKFEYLNIFLEAINKFQRKTSSMSELSQSDYKHLMNCISGLGGWKNVLLILEKELFEAPKREKKFQSELSEILAEAKIDYHKRKTARKLRGVGS